jgi:mannitol-1-phosphate/altronate dehydrogenase
VSKRIISIGAGGLALGFFGPELYQDYALTFLDMHFKADLIEGIQKHHCFMANIAGETIKRVKIDNVDAFRIDLPEEDAAIREQLAETSIIFTAVGLKNLDSALLWLDERLRGRTDPIYILCAENGEGVADKWRSKFPGNIHLCETVMGRMCRLEEQAEPEYANVLPGIEWGVVGEALYDMPLSDEFYNPEVFHSKAFLFVPEAEFHARERIKLFAHNGLHFFIAIQGRLRGAERFSDLANDKEVVEAATALLNEELAPALWKDCGQAVGESHFKEYMERLPKRLFSDTLRDHIARGVRGVDVKFAPNERVMGGLKLLLDNGIVPNRYLDLLAMGLQVVTLDNGREAADELLQNMPEDLREDIAARWEALGA